MSGLTIQNIQNAVAAHYNMTSEKLLSRTRVEPIVLPRQVAMYLARKTTHRSYPAIARVFGGRDHTTVMHAVKKIGELADTDPVFASNLRAIQEALRPVASPKPATAGISMKPPSG